MKEVYKTKRLQTRVNRPKLKHIAISIDNYQLLKKFGKFGDTYNDIVTVLLEKVKKSDSRVGPHFRTAIRAHSLDSHLVILEELQFI